MARKKWLRLERRHDAIGLSHGVGQFAGNSWITLTFGIVDGPLTCMDRLAKLHLTTDQAEKLARQLTEYIARAAISR